MLPKHPRNSPHPHSRTSLTPHPLAFLRPIALHSYHPNPTHESSAPRRQPDGGVPPAANDRGGDQAPPWQRACPRRPCCCAVLVVARRDGVCLEERPAGIERSGVAAVVDTASRQATASIAAVQHAVSTRPGSGVRDPAVQPSGVRSPGVVVQRVRHSAVCCPPIQRPAVCCPAVRYPAVWCLPPSVRTRPSPPMLRRWRWGPGRGGRATVTPGTGGGPGGCRAVVGSTTVQEAGTRATLPTSRRSVEGRWRTRAAGLGAGRGGRA
jgi:hypothetical protein